MNKLEFATQIQKRTKSFALQVIRFLGRIPKRRRGECWGTTARRMPVGNLLILNSLIH
jgi:hypothetical protein